MEPVNQVVAISRSLYGDMWLSLCGGAAFCVFLWRWMPDDMRRGVLTLATGSMALARKLVPIAFGPPRFDGGVPLWQRRLDALIILTMGVAVTLSMLTWMVMLSVGVCTELIPLAGFGWLKVLLGEAYVLVGIYFGRIHTVHAWQALNLPKPTPT